MTLYITLRPGWVDLRGSVEVPKTGETGEIRVRIHPGEKYRSMTYEELRAHGDGAIELGR
jgi:hypothetical protein